MELKDTIEMMQSEDYAERFKAEYYQLRIRYKKLIKMLIRYEDGTLDFEPNSTLEILKKQSEQMRGLLITLEIRSFMENIVL